MLELGDTAAGRKPRSIQDRAGLGDVAATKGLMSSDLNRNLMSSGLLLMTSNGHTGGCLLLCLLSPATGARKLKCNWS